MVTIARDPRNSQLANHTERDLLVKILAELRVQTLIMAQDSNFKDDISALRDEVMLYGNQTSTDL
jgi:hypothetical protein